MLVHFVSELAVPQVMGEWKLIAAYRSILELSLARASGLYKRELAALWASIIIRMSGWLGHDRIKLLS